jgi:hypothetical protein
MLEQCQKVIQDAFANCLTAEEIAELYAGLMYEIRFQMSDSMSEYVRAVEE